MPSGRLPPQGARVVGAGPSAHRPPAAWRAGTLPEAVQAGASRPVAPCAHDRRPGSERPLPAQAAPVGVRRGGRGRGRPGRGAPGVLGCVRGLVGGRRAAGRSGRRRLPPRGHPRGGRRRVRRALRLAAAPSPEHAVGRHRRPARPHPVRAARGGVLPRRCAAARRADAAAAAAGVRIPGRPAGLRRDAGRAARPAPSARKPRVGPSRRHLQADRGAAPPGRCSCACCCSRGPGWPRGSSRSRGLRRRRGTRRSRAPPGRRPRSAARASPPGRP